MSEICFCESKEHSRKTQRTFCRASCHCASSLLLFMAVQPYFHMNKEAAILGQTKQITGPLKPSMSAGVVTHVSEGCNYAHKVAAYV